MMLGKVTFDDHTNAFERYRKGDVSYTFTKPLIALFPKLGVIKGLISPDGLVLLLAL